MPLADDLRELRDRATAELAAGHDYYVHTTLAWDLVGQSVASGAAFSVRNPATGTVLTPAELVARSKRYAAVQLREATFVQFISTFEAFFFDLLRLWLRAYPGSLGEKDVKFRTVLAAADRDAVVRLVVDKEVNEVMYERPAAWFAYLDTKVKLGCPTADQVERVAEAKAARDVLVHNRGLVNKSYREKAGKFARHAVGERMDLPEPYHRQTWELFGQVTEDIAAAAAAKSA